MPAAAAGIGAVGSIVGGVAQGKGAKKAAQIQSQSAAQQMQLLKDMYSMNSQNFQPEIQSGNAAVDMRNRLLGLSPANASSVSIPFNNGLGSSSNTNGFSPSYGSTARGSGFGNMGIEDGRQDFGGGMQETRTDVPNASTAQAPAQAPAQSITDLIRSQPGYEFRYQQAMNGTNANAYASGMAGSGATLKALQDRAYNVADNYYQQYLGNVSDVVNTGVGSKSALAGVSQNFANSSNSVNQNAANASAGYQMYKAQNLSNVINSVAGAAGSAFGSSFGGGASGGGAGAAFSALSGSNQAAYGGSGAYTPFNYNTGFGNG